LRRSAFFLVLLAAALGARLGAAELTPAAKTLTTICYHRFGAETAKDPYKISLERLNAQLDWLQAQGYQSISLKQLQEAVDRGPQALPPKSLLLTVDDGYQAGALGAEAFAAHGFKGVFFVNPGTLGKGHFMSWQACRDLEKQGHEVASHTWSHENLGKPNAKDTPASYRAWVDKELGQARRRLEKELGHPVSALAYPYGAYNPAVTVAAQRAGYQLHFTVSDGPQDAGHLDPLRLHRTLLMGHPSQANFEKRMTVAPVTAAFGAMQDGALFFQGGQALGLTPTAQDLKLSVEGKPVTELPGSLRNGFHFLTLQQGARQTKLLFQIARAEWAPYFNALTEN
jgi:peptidoglycan/xylan/chitin deacetylase (PgdA/CDA1 family)